MLKSLSLTISVICCWAVVAFGQATDTPFQVHDATNLNLGDARITITNSGAFSTVAFPNQNGQLCANVYGFSGATGLLTSCCSCLIAPNALASLSVWRDVLTDSPPVSPTPTALTVKLIASAPTGNPLTCNAATVGTGPNVLVPGPLAWMTEPEPSGFFNSPPEVVKTQFAPATLSAAELFGTTAQCAILHPGPHACPSCP